MPNQPEPNYDVALPCFTLLLSFQMQVVFID